MGGDRLAIAFSGLLILGGRAADLFGRRRLFIVALAATLVAWRASRRQGGLPDREAAELVVPLK